MGTLALIYVNERILLLLGWTDLASYQDINIRNSSFVFGIPDHYEKGGIIFDIFVFKFLKTNPFTGESQYWPVIWMIVPVSFIAPVVATITNSPFILKRALLKQKNK